MPQFAGDIQSAYRRLIAGVPSLHDGYELLEEPRVTGPFPVACTRGWRANLVLAGDAAGFFDGISGEGMSIALASSRDCAVAVDQYLATRSYAPFRAYDRQRRALARNSTLLARLSLFLGGHPTLARLAVRNLARRPEAFAKLVAINGGERGLMSLRPRDFAALLAGL
jgi:flavin-dependent dehydrogenase